MPRTDVAGQLRSCRRRVQLGEHQPVEAVADADDVPAPVAPGEHDGADDGVEPGRVAAAGRDGDAPDRTASRSSTERMSASRTRRGVTSSLATVGQRRRGREI